MSGTRRVRIIEPRRRARVVHWYYALHVIVLVCVVGGIVVAGWPFAHPGDAAVIGTLLGVWGASSALLLTVGLLGVYELSYMVISVKLVATVISLVPGLMMYGFGLVTTPFLLLVGIVLRLTVIGVQRLLGVRREPARSESADHSLQAPIR